jgi:integrase
MPKLTAKSIENWKPQPKRQEIPDAGARGLYLIVQPSGIKSFAVRFRLAGKTHKLCLPRSTSLAEARKEAADAYATIEKGRDPGAIKKVAKAHATASAADTIEAVCTEYMKREGGGLRTARDRERALQNHVYPVIGSRPVADVTRLELIRLLEKIGDDQGKKRAAGLVLAYLRRVFNWYATRHDTFKSPIVKGMYQRGNGTPRARVLNDEELRKVWAAGENSTNPFTAYIRFLLLTAARRKEASALPWDEIDGEGNWILPARRNKKNFELVRPLSKKARDLLAAQPRAGDFVFSVGHGPLNGFASRKRSFDKLCGVTNWTLHDLRRTARTLLSRAGVNADHAERCLGHKIPGVRGIYDRYEFLNEKRLAYRALAKQIDLIVNPPKGNISQLRRRA